MEVFDGPNGKIRLMIFSSSILWFIFGNFCMIVGGLSHGIIGKTEQDFHLSEFQLAGLAISLIPLGSLTIFSSFFGCCAAIKGSRRMTFANLTVLYILAFIKFVIACVLFSQFSATNIDEKVERGLSEVLNRTVVENVTDRYTTKELFGEKDIFAEEVHSIHTTYQCCGVKGPDFYDVKKVPHSCCINAEDLSRFHTCQENQEKHEEGCAFQVVAHINDAKTWLANFLIVVSIIEFTVGFFEFYVTKHIKDI